MQNCHHFTDNSFALVCFGFTGGFTKTRLSLVKSLTLESGCKSVPHLKTCTSLSLFVLKTKMKN